MKKLMMIVFLLTACHQQADEKAVNFAKPADDVTARTLIIFYDQQQSVALERALAKYHAEILYHYHTLSGLAVRLPQEVNLPQVERELSQLPWVFGINRDQQIQLH